MLKTLYKELQKELLIAHKKVHTFHWKKDLDKNKARLAYEKMQLIRSRQPTDKIQAQLDALESGKIDIPPLDSHKVKTLLDSEDDVHNLQNVTAYLKNQRIYNELLERYNPGLTMSQEDNVRKTANRVGLSIPEKI
ncbi:hypothetical protein JCM33374_g2015 [Metschnikowia sp. JCM 33374]|nr:hypothetical protein JCM33374_g2015 [Metschnikowia sp. JCM 33374]